MPKMSGEIGRRDLLKLLMASGCAAAASAAVAGVQPRQSGIALVRFAVFSDIHERPEMIELIAAHLKGKFDFTVLNGDMIEDVRDAGSVAKYIVEPMKKLSARFGAPCHFVRGNHEWRGPEKDRLGELMSLGDEVFYRAFTLNGVRFVLLDTFEEAKGKYEPFVRMQAAENEWLKKEISSSSWRNAVQRVAIMHIAPPFEPYPDKPTRWACTSPGLQEMDGILDRSGVSLVCGAHLHLRRICGPTGYRRYPVAVGGGPEWKSDVAICVSVYGDGIGVQQIDANGKVVDSAFFRGDS
ncbi:MAG: metallophosphoesterase [Kiritimatiellae bacterium]|nr:metallophosphoesterase [Kiritimatiellia bacterium]